MIPTFPPPDRLAIKVKPSVEKIIRQGHPWIFEQGITKQNKEGKAGDIAVIFDQKKNQVLAVGLYDPDSVIRVKVLSLDKVVIDSNYLKRRIQEAYQKRIPLLQTDTNSYRLIHGENDRLPSFIADVYAHAIVVKLYSTMWLPFLQWMIEGLLEVTNCSVVVIRLSRQLQKSKGAVGGLIDGQVIKGELKDPVVQFKEHGLCFSANLIKGHKTGYFLDHRHNRKKIRELAKGKSVLDVFAYAGGFSVNAVAGGATKVTSLDISAQALKMAEYNMALNFDNAPHSTLVGDAFLVMRDLAKKGQSYDLIIVDPPAFAKKETEIERAIYQYVQLTKAAVQLVKKGGILLMASCSSRVNKEQFYEVILSTLQALPISFKKLECTQHDIDHPIGFKEGAYLKSIFILRE